MLDTSVVIDLDQFDATKLTVEVSVGAITMALGVCSRVGVRGPRPGHRGRVGYGIKAEDGPTGLNL